MERKDKKRDVEHLATVKMLGLRYLISYDRHFKKFIEHKTPKEFIKELGLKESNTEY
ncbi:MAG: hypothetical protein QXY62_01495 [Candidatus Altiarchaeota archaeon]